MCHSFARTAHCLFARDPAMIAPSEPGTNRSLSAMERLRNFIATAGDAGWDAAWKDSATPWDAGAVQPPLYDLVMSKELDLPQTGRALIPGCGRGYDAIFIASSLNLDTLAVDISETAVSAANELLAKSDLPNSVQVRFEMRDFFTLAASGEEKFDMVYDYTFFVAIPPTRRTDWGRQMTDLVKPGGYLITLVFPIDPPQEIGPPFFIRPEHYIEPLGDTWIKVLDKIPERSSETHVNRERLVVWKKL